MEFLHQNLELKQQKELILQKKQQTQIGQQLDEDLEQTVKDRHGENLKEVRVVIDPKLVKQKKTLKWKMTHKGTPKEETIKSMEMFFHGK